MNKNQIVGIVVFCLTFICLSFGGFEVWAFEVWSSDSDSLDLAIGYTTAYPGGFVKISVLLKNPVPISSFVVHITLGGWFERANFHTDSMGTENVLVPVDTCPENPDTVCTVDTCSCGQGEPDTCICFEYRDVTVRYCYIDTVGSLISDFETVTCHGDTMQDPYLPDVVTVYGYAGTDSLGELKYIPPRGNYDTLFTLGVDLSCMCDQDSGRSVYFLVSQGFSNFSDNLGYSVPFRYHMGELFAWWSVAGDANNDSAVNSADVVFLLNYLFTSGGPSPCIPEAADPDSSCAINSADLVYLLNYLYGGGPVSKRGCFCPNPQAGSRINEDYKLYELFEEPNLKPLLERR
ncbi:MAG: dockerin type I repeat-containing protein [Candidatus Zixiibacteriota bacterium]